MADRHDVFISYSRAYDRDAAILLQQQLAQAGLTVFRDETGVGWSDLWLERLQEELDACRAFVLLVGREGVRRWVSAELQVALIRHFGPRNDAERLPLFPVLLGDTAPEDLLAFLRLPQAVRWDGTSPLANELVEQIRERKLGKANTVPVAGCPFVGLAAFAPKHAQLFFGRQKEKLEALACFDERQGAPRVRWLEIQGDSGSGKSSLMNAGLLPLVDQGWLWPRTGYEHWRRIEPLIPGEHPLENLAECLTRAFPEEQRRVEQHEVCEQLEQGDERRLAQWLKTRKPDDDTAFLLPIDQFEELFTIADETERRRLDQLLANALADRRCPLFVISTVRSDFLSHFEKLPRLLEVRNRFARPWLLPPIGAQGLQEIIDGPAALAGLDVSEVRTTIIAEAEGEPGALPLVQHALQWLWDHRKGRKLSGAALREAGGLAGILSEQADRALVGVDRERALELLLTLVRPDPEGRRHTRRRISRTDAVKAAGGGETGEAIVDHLSGGPSQERRGLRLLTVTSGDAAGGNGEPTVSLIHETLVRSRVADAEGDVRPYWPTLWNHIEANLYRARRHERLRLLAQEIADDAGRWEAAGRDERERWPEHRCLEVIREVDRAGACMADVLGGESARAFFGPSERDEIDDVLRGGEGDDADSGSGFYGPFWRLPLGHEARARLGDRLAVGDDGRPGVGLRPDGVPDIEWRTVDGGDITIEDRTVEVAAFRMAKYPVTIRQFRAFVEACHRHGRWHLDEFPVDKLEEPPRHAGRYGNYPADTVSWYDATAFCRWLSGQLGFEVRLPTEFEWQLAATGGDLENAYPWGPDWKPEREPWRANTRESGLGRTTAVGLYPAGASRARIHDLAGTVWEWCSTVHADGSTGDVFDDRPRVLRGGSWDFFQASARCALRYFSHPLGRGSFIGFRVVCSSPIVTAEP